MLSYASHDFTEATRNTNLSIQFSIRNESVDVLIISVTSDSIWVKQWWSRHSWRRLVGTSEYNIIHTGQLHNPLKQLSSSDFSKNLWIFFSLFLSLVLPHHHLSIGSFRLLIDSNPLGYGFKDRDLTQPASLFTRVHSESPTLDSTHGHFQGCIGGEQMKCIF